MWSLALYNGADTLTLRSNEQITTGVISDVDMEKDRACKMDRQNKKCSCARKSGRRKNNTGTDKSTPVVPGYHTRHWIRGSRVQTGRDRWIFQSVKILSMTSFGRDVKPWVLVVDLRHVKEPQAEIRAFEKNLSDFSRSL